MTSCGSTWQSSGATATITLTDNVPVGAMLVVTSVCNNLNGFDTATAADSKGNTYGRYVPASSVSGAVCVISQFATIVENALTVGDTVTVTLPTAASRQAHVADYYTDIWGRDLADANYSTASASTTIATGTIVPDATGDLILMSVGSSGNDLVTPAIGWNVGSTIVTAAGTNERRISSFWRYAADSTTPVNGLGTLPSATVWTASIDTFYAGTPGPPESITWTYYDGSTETAIDTWSFWDGSAETSVDAWEYYNG